MMQSIFNFRLLLTITAFLTLGMSACKKDSKGSEAEAKYSALMAVGAWPNIGYYIANVYSLTEGTINLKGSGAELTGKVYAQDVLQRNGFYYHLNFDAGKLGKYHVENGQLVTDKEVPFTFFWWGSYTWVDEGTLVLIGDGDDNDGNYMGYAIVKVENMEVTTGKLKLNAVPSGFDSYTPGFCEYRNGKIYLGYGYLSDDWTNYPDMPVYQKFYVAAMSYPSMTVEATSEDTRSTAPGSDEVYARRSFVDENGDIYFMTDPVSSYDYTSPSAIYRIKSGSNQIDGTYFFNLSSKTSDGMGAAMWYIGDGKAIIRTREAGQNVDGLHSFSLVNVQTGTFIKKLPLPDDVGQRMVQAVIVEDGKAYIAVNAEDKDYIWEYDPATDKVTAGAEFIGGADFILRLEKLR